MRDPELTKDVEPQPSSAVTTRMQSKQVSKNNKVWVSGR